MNDGKQLMLGLSTKHYYSSNSRISMHNIIDIGYAIDQNASVSFKPSLRQTDVSSYYYPCQVLWKNGVITYDNNNNIPNLWWRPVEYYIRHKIVGTTKTIQAYNNPKRFGGKSFKLTITNDTTKLRD
jgi:adenine specific DNA methylase Mod